MGTQWLMGAGSLAAGLGGGIMAGLFGIGGGIVLIPMLGLLLGLNQHQAQGITLAAMILPNGLPAVLLFRRRGIPIHWALVALLTLGFLPSVWAGARIASRIPDGPLRMGFALVLLLMAVGTWFQKPATPRAPGQTPRFRRMLLPGLGAGLLGGLASGLLGIGGGLVIIPILAWGLDLAQHEAQAACLAFMLAPIGLPGVLVYAQSQSLPWHVLAGVAVGFMGGSHLGARLATNLLGPSLRKAFAVLMVCVALMMLS